jgi:hypothetical protein
MKKSAIRAWYRWAPSQVKSGHNTDNEKVDTLADDAKVNITIDDEE